MSSEERKQKFIKLLYDLIDKQGGVKGKLAQVLKISPSRLSHWLQGKTDPAGLDILTFNQLAKVKGCSIHQLAQFLGFAETQDQSQARFRALLEDLLLDKTQEELANNLGINRTTISKWLKLEQQIDWGNISAKTMFSLSQEKNWTLDKLFNYLKLESNKELGNNNNNKFSTNVINSQSICIILETENLAIATNYASNLAIHLNLKPENIKVTTIPNLPESIADIDILIFDISSPESASISLIEDIEFDRDIVVFIDADLPSEVRSSLENKVTDLLFKPIDWQVLKDKAYFS